MKHIHFGTLAYATSLQIPSDGLEPPPPRGQWRRFKPKEIHTGTGTRGVELLRIPSRWKLRRAPTASADVRVTTRTSPASLHDAHESLRQSTSREVSTVEIQFSCGPRPGWSKRDSLAMSRGDSQSSCGVRQARLRTSPDEGCRARPVQLMRSEAID